MLVVVVVVVGAKAVAWVEGEGLAEGRTFFVRRPCEGDSGGSGGDRQRGRAQHSTGSQTVGLQRPTPRRRVSGQCGLTMWLWCCAGGAGRSARRGQRAGVTTARGSATASSVVQWRDETVDQRGQ